VAAFAACEPIAHEYSTGTIYTADQLDISATPIVVDGMKSNKIVLKNNTPILGEWNYGTGSSRLSMDTAIMIRRGDVHITFTGLNADGSKIAKTISVTVEDLSFPVPAEWELLCGNGEKQWTWDYTRDAVWNESGYRVDFLPDEIDWWWWPVSAEEINDEYFDAGYGDGAFMTFSMMQNAVFSKVTGDASASETGSFSFNMSRITYAEDEETVWAIGKLYLSGTTVLCGKIPVDDYERMIPVYEFDILVLNEEELVLAYAPPGSAPWDAAYFWMFKVKQ
jgi:hypothetical protein